MKMGQAQIASGAPNTRPRIRLHEFAGSQALYDAAFITISKLAREAISARNAFHLVLAGGNTPLPLYRRLNGLDTNWNAWHLYLGDERCLPGDHPERNSFLINEAWLNESPIPKNQIHFIAAESDAETAALEYAKSIEGVKFDLVLLGVGEDGHTASLFPGKDWGEAEDAFPVLAVHDAPKMPPDRVSLSARRLSDARTVIFLVSGISKRDAMTRLIAGDRIPASSINPESGIDIYADFRL